MQLVALKQVYDQLKHVIDSLVNSNLKVQLALIPLRSSMNHFRKHQLSVQYAYDLSWPLFLLLLEYQSVNFKREAHYKS